MPTVSAHVAQTLVRHVDRPYLLLDCRISGEVIAPYQQEIIRVNS